MKPKNFLPNSPNKIKHIFFDWSGTLFDDFEVSHQSTQTTLKHFGGPEISIEEYKNEFILPAIEFYKKFIANPPYLKIEEFYFNQFMNVMWNGSFFKNAVSNLKKLKRKNIKLYIFSTVRQDLLEKKCEKFKVKKYFTHIFGDKANKEKTLPQTIKELKLKRDEVLFIGDMEHDIKAAKKAKIKSGVFLCGYRHAENLVNQSPDFIWRNHEDFSKFIAWVGQVRQVRPVGHIGPIGPIGPIPTVGCLIENQGKILLIQTHKWSHTFGIPGGKIKIGETQIEALKREIFEECGLKIKNIKFAMIHDSINSKEFYKPNQHFLLMNFYAQTNQLNVKLNNEAESAFWIEPNQALKLNLNEPTRVLIENYLTSINLIANLPSL